MARAGVVTSGISLVFLIVSGYLCFVLTRHRLLQAKFEHWDFRLDDQQQYCHRDLHRGR